jgi:hypothetical protein
MRTSCIPVTLAGFLVVAVATTPVEAQGRARPRPKETRFELTPFAGYQWGGSFDTQASGVIPAGELKESDGLSYGVILSFTPQPQTAVELTYVRQDNDLTFRSLAGANIKGPADFANNYIQIGGRWSFIRPKESGAYLSPFITASLGINVVDLKDPCCGSDTRFAWSLGTGAKYMFAGKPIGIRADLRWWIMPVSSGTYGTYCDFYGCFVVEGTAWVNQGQVSGGLVFAF